jgi:hypothetical protein
LRPGAHDDVACAALASYSEGAINNNIDA